MEYVGGWLYDQEDSEWLYENSLPPQTHKLRAMRTWQTPEEMDFRGKLQVENQGGMGSCFPAGTKVTMADGSLRHIEDVQVGDLVLTHNRRARRVLRTMSRKYTGKMHSVFVKGWGRIHMTHDHAVMVGESWRLAEDLRIGDEMVVSHGIPDTDTHCIRIDSFVDGDLYLCGDAFRISNSPSIAPVSVPLCKDLCFLLGLYAAEGSARKSSSGTVVGCTWTLHREETHLVARIADYFRCHGVEPSVIHKKDSNAVTVRIDNPPWAQFFHKSVGAYCNKKHVPQFILSGHKFQKLAFLRGWFNGDGSYKKLDSGRESCAGNIVKCNQVHACTASRVLAQQCATMLASIGMKPGRTCTKARSHQRHPSYQVYLYSNDATYMADMEESHVSHRRIKENCFGQLRPVRQIEVLEVADVDVYDFEVEEDHSFVAQGLIVHNCQGHALTSATELAYFFETGDWIQLNRMFAYVNSQRKDGIRGDRGSTISGGVRCVKDDGICLEATWPYTGRYTTEIPQKCFEEAEDYRIKTAVQMRSYDDVFEFLASGIGGINIGIMWGLPSAAVIESYRSGGGGHAVCLGGYTKRKDSQGRNYILLFNSWGAGWGNQGVAEVAPKAIEDMLRARFTEAYGLSDMVNIEPRRIKYRFL